MGMAYERYEDVPWYRRSWANNLFVLFGLFGCLPLLRCRHLIAALDTRARYARSIGALDRLDTRSAA